MILNPAFALLLFYILESFAQTPKCPETFPEECFCLDSMFGPIIYCITVPMVSTWDIEATFDEISDSINDNNTVVATVELSLALLSQQQEISAHSISTLKAETMTVHADWKLTRIDPEAFSGTHNTVKSFAVYQMNFTNSQEAFHLANNFKNLKFLEFFGGTSLAEVPPNALSAELQELASVRIDGAGLNSIGDFAFAAPPNLIYVSLVDNSITLDQISNSAFTFAKQRVMLMLERNPGITHLPEDKFGEFLTGHNSLYVGSGFNGGSDPNYFLNCDERMNWFCGRNFTRVFGYECIESEYNDIYDYCSQQVNNHIN